MATRFTTVRAAGACRGGKTPAAIVASGKTMMPDSLGLADVQTGTVIGCGPLHNAGRKKGRHAGRNPEGLSPPGKKLHPDLNPGNKVAEEKFKEVSAANDLLSDQDKRARYDRGEIDASGMERPRQQYYRDFADQDGWSAYTNNSGFADFGDYAGTEDILSEIFGCQGRAARRRRG
jgi:DnaJ domain